MAAQAPAAAAAASGAVAAAAAATAPDLKSALSAFEAELSALGALGGDDDGDAAAPAAPAAPASAAAAAAGPPPAPAVDPFRGLGVPVEPEAPLPLGRVALASAPKLKDEKAPTSAAASSSSSAAAAASSAALHKPVRTDSAVRASASVSAAAAGAPSSGPNARDAGGDVRRRSQAAIISSGPQLTLQPGVGGSADDEEPTEMQRLAAATMAFDAAAKARVKSNATAHYPAGHGGGGAGNGGYAPVGGAAAGSGSGGGGGEDGDDGDEHGGRGGGGGSGPMRHEKKKKFLRAAGGKIWEDKSMADWPDNDFRIFVGDLGNEVNESALQKAFGKYKSFHKAHVVRDKRSQKTKGFGFVSFLDPHDCAAALREMNGKYIGNRPVKLRKSTHAERDLSTVRKEHRLIKPANPQGKAKNHI